MLILKFSKHIDDENGVTSESYACIEHVVSCQSYESYTRADGSVSILVFKGFTKADGVEFQVSQAEAHFDVCYVENSAGKTINVYRKQTFMAAKSA